MDIVRFSIARPITVAVGVILVVMFGLIGFGAIPIQLTPNVDEPIITVETGWTGRTPQEIVDEIIKDQEEVLKNLNGLKKMTATASEGAATITLEFFIGTDPEEARTEVSDSLRQVADYPDEVDEPVIQDADNQPDNAIAWIILDVAPEHRDKTVDFDITTIEDAIDRRLKPELERVDGVAVINVYGGREREMRVEIDSQRLALLNLNHLQVLDALRSENRNVSAGTIAEGKRDYRVRVIGQFTSEQDILDTVITYAGGDPIYIKDVAQVRLDHVKRRGFVRSMGENAIAINAVQRSGSNVMEVMEGIRGKLDVVERDVLKTLHPEYGQYLRLRQVYDETVYIESAISLVTQNLWVGGGIAVIVLLVFLRSFVSTGVIALAIPISVIGTFLILLALGRTLNVISLAGLAFAVGMVVDNAIVVLENIDRHRAMGKQPVKAAYDGGKEVWGAVLASTLTTVAVFVPILTIQDEAGQLFRDISLAIVASVSLSLIVSVTVIPAACGHFFSAPEETPKKRPLRDTLNNLFGLAPALDALTRQYSALVGALMKGWAGATVRPLLILAMAIVSLAGAVLLMPPPDYLPAGNKNLVFGGLLIPPGYSVEQRETLASRIEEQVGPYLQDPNKPEIDESTLAPIVDGRSGVAFAPVRSDNFFIGAFGTQMFVGGTSIDPERVKPIGTLLTNAMTGVPDSYGGAGQSSLFGRSFGGGTAVDVEILGPDLERVTAAMNQLYNSLGVSESFGYQNLRGTPANFNLSQPETRVRVSDLGLELGLRPAEMGTAVRALFDGAFAGDFQTENEAIDIRLLPQGGRLEHLQQLAEIPIATPRGPVVPLDTLIRFEEGTAPQEIVRVEELPAIRMAVTLPDGMPVSEGRKLIDEQFIEPLRRSGAIDGTMQVRYEGTAAKLQQVYAALLGDTELEGSDSVSNASIGISSLIFFAAFGTGIYAFLRAARAGRGSRMVYGAIGFLCVGAIVGGLFLLVGTNQQFITARFIWALAVTYLLMCALFESFVYPFVVMFSVPLALVGGFAGLSIVHATTDANPLVGTQNLDVLTMLGFVILVGIVVNNAILIVHQSLNLMRGVETDEHGNPVKLAPHDAVVESLRTRIRPVFMSTMTSVGGMLPLVLFPGAGSELYRGLGSVVVGGLLVSTVFTLLLVPLTLSLVLDMTAGMARVLGRNENDDRRAEALAA